MDEKYDLLDSLSETSTRGFDDFGPMSSTDQPTLSPLSFPYDLALDSLLPSEENPHTYSIPLPIRRPPRATSPPLEATVAKAPVKRKTRRQQSRKKVHESEALRKLKEQRDELLKNPQDLPESELKRLHQLLRNRISAQQSRDKKKQYLIDLESKQADMAEEHRQLEKRLQRLEAQNKSLKRTHLGFSGKSLQKSAVFAALLSLMVIAGSVHTEPDAKKALASFELKDFRNSEGLTAHEALVQTLSEMGTSIEECIQEVLTDQQELKGAQLPPCQIKSLPLVEFEDSSLTPQTS